MTRSVDNFSKFLNTVKPQTRSSSAEAVQQQQRPAPSGATQQVLQRVLDSPDGIDLGVLYKETALDFSVFADAVEKLKKLGGIRVVKDQSGETAFPGPNCREVESLVS